MNRNHYSKRDARIGLALNYFFIYLSDEFRQCYDPENEKIVIKFLHNLA